jgi:hypothetical protein
MANYIFLKSLRSLEEYRKNPHVKIPPNSPSTNFQCLDKFKNPIFNSEIIFSLLSARPTLRPVRLLDQPTHRPRRPHKPKQSRPAHPARASVAPSRQIRFPFGSHLPETVASPLSLCQPAPPVRFTPFPTPADPGRKFPRAAAPPRRCPASRMPLSFYSPPSSLSSLNPLQTEP